MIQITLNQGGLIDKSEGEDVAEALEALKPKVIKSAAKMFIKDGKRKAEIFYYPIQAKRLIANKFNRILQVKRIEMLLK